MPPFWKYDYHTSTVPFPRNHRRKDPRHRTAIKPNGRIHSPIRADVITNPFFCGPSMNHPTQQEAYSTTHLWTLWPWGSGSSGSATSGPWSVSACTWCCPGPRTRSAGRASRSGRTVKDESRVEIKVKMRLRVFGITFSRKWKTFLASILTLFAMWLVLLSQFSQSNWSKIYSETFIALWKQT